MSSAELSIDISQVVSRAVSGERIDAGLEGRTLAARYPGLGMSADLIGKAIVRAAEMTGVQLEAAPEPVEAAAPGPAYMDGHPSLSAAADAGSPGPDHQPGLPPLPEALGRPVAALRRAYFGE